MTPTLQPIIDALEQQRRDCLDDVARLGRAIAILRREDLRQVPGAPIQPIFIETPAPEPQPQGLDMSNMSLDEVVAHWKELHLESSASLIPEPSALELPATVEEPPSQEPELAVEEVATVEAVVATVEVIEGVETPLAPPLIEVNELVHTPTGPEKVEKYCPRCGPRTVLPDQKKCRCNAFFKGEVMQRHQAEALASEAASIAVAQSTATSMRKGVTTPRTCPRCGPVNLPPARKRCFCGEPISREGKTLEPPAERPLPAGVVKEDGVLVAKRKGEGSLADRLRSNPF